MRTVRFYFDPISPYVWLAYRQLPAVEARTGARFEMVPVLFAGLLAATENKGPAEIPAKRAYTFRDVARWAVLQGYPMVGPPSHPFNPLRALRACAALEDADARRRLAGALILGAWERGMDLADDVHLAELVASADLDPAALLPRTDDPAVKARLKANTEAALAQGAFGVPTFVVDGELFWGSDRMAHLEAFLAGGLAIDEAQARAILARPRAATRRIPG